MKKRYFIIGLIVLVLVGGGVFGKSVYDDVKASENMDKVLDLVEQEKIKTEDIDYKSLGKYAPYVKNFSVSYSKLMKDMDELNAVIDSGEFKSSVSTKFMKDPTAGKENMKKLLDKVTNIKKKMDEDTAGLSKAFDNMSAPDKEKAKILKAEEDTKKSINNDSTSLFTLFKTISDKTNAFYDFLISKKGSYTVENNGINFYSQKDVDSYNKYIDDIVKIADQTKK